MVPVENPVFSAIRSLGCPRRRSVTTSDLEGLGIETYDTNMLFEGWNKKSTYEDAFVKRVKLSVKSVNFIL
jgi:hypothetical protein